MMRSLRFRISTWLWASTITCVASTLATQTSIRINHQAASVEICLGTKQPQMTRVGFNFSYLHFSRLGEVRIASGHSSRNLDLLAWLLIAGTAHGLSTQILSRLRSIRREVETPHPWHSAVSPS